MARASAIEGYATVMAGSASSVLANLQEGAIEYMIKSKLCEGKKGDDLDDCVESNAKIFESLTNQVKSKLTAYGAVADHYAKFSARMREMNTAIGNYCRDAGSRDYSVITASEQMPTPESVKTAAVAAVREVNTEIAEAPRAARARGQMPKKRMIRSKK
jgi:hypothetical protein